MSKTEILKASALGLFIGTKMISLGITAFEAFIMIAAFTFAYFVIPGR